MSIELTLLSTVSYRGEEITAPRLRGLLALLAGELRGGCSTARIVEGLWPDEQPENPVKAVQVLASRTRAKLGSELLVSTPVGYRLALSEDEVDCAALLLHVSAAAEKARNGDHAGALAEAEAGLELWDGPGAQGAGAAMLGDPVAALRDERAAAHRALERARALGLARTGRREEAAPRLGELVREQPRDEELLLELVRCEAATTCTATALTTYDRYRRGLRDELGTDPGPALRALHQELLREETPTVRRGVPHEPNELLGRARDLDAVAELLRSSRVTTVVGPGGLGKTRLAAAVSRAAEQRVVCMVPLAGVADDADVAGEVASALGVADAPRTPAGGPSGELVAGLLAALGPGPALLVLDNCEHVVHGVASLVRALVAASRDLRVLTTSRTPLGLSSESVHPLPELDRATAVELFTQRARAARPDVELPPDAVAALCRRLDGLPLATELAAARVRVLSVAEIDRRLEDRFALLRGGSRDAPQRHRTLHAVVDWSWNLLTTEGRAALRALSVFPGGFTADSACHLLDGGDGSGGRGGEDGRGGDDGGDGTLDALDVLDLLQDLVDQSLLKVTDTPVGTRFHMLETVREFSAARRIEAGEGDAVARRFASWARDFGLAHHDAPFGADAYAAWRSIRSEQDNLTRALRLALDSDGVPDLPTVTAIAAVLGSLWTTEANYVRLTVLAEDTGHLLSHYRPTPPYVEPTRTIAALVTANAYLGSGSGAPRFMAVLRRLPPPSPTGLIGAIATVLNAMPAVLNAETPEGPEGTGSPEGTGGPEGAGGSDRTLLDALRASEEPLLAGVAEGLAGYLWESAHEPERAMESTRRMLAHFEGRRVPWLAVLGLSRMSELCLNTERGAEALGYMERAMRVMDELGDWKDMVGLRWGMVLASLQTGDLDGAEHWLDLAVRHRPEEAVDLLTPDLGARAEIALARGETESGLALWRRATGVLDDVGTPLTVGEPPVESWVRELRAVTVAAHAQHSRLDLVEDLLTALPAGLASLLSGREGGAAPLTPVGFPTCGALLLALGYADLARGRTETGVRLVALADRFRCLRSFQPTMSSARSRRAAEDADPAAYADAVSEYAALKRGELASAALALLDERRE
ncbi:AfsR/SARP family transcriptional regulator [Streptomyces sp. NBC_00250]|uniref:ATP-binding protein n=1 Tax=Streptomyces sp. NBC_00250 TaxID=2903641 RepID=UPI002E289D24|nr:BTAD domain-containing putative transcriptional regulator [Streptomyces sp. NBC_00250]